MPGVGVKRGKRADGIAGSFTVGLRGRGDNPNFNHRSLKTVWPSFSRQVGPRSTSLY